MASSTRLALGFAATCSVSPVHGDVFNWNNPTGGDFHMEPHWSPNGGPPGPFDVARFLLGGKFQVHLSASAVNQQLIVDSTGFSLDLNGHDYTITGDDPGASFAGECHVFGGTLLTQYGIIEGNFEFDQPRSTWENAERIYIGLSEPGTVHAHSGADVSTWRTYIAGEINVPGTLSLDGEGTTWTCSGLMIVGANGDGMLNILQNAIVNSVGGEIAGDYGSGGAAIVQTGGVWNITDNTYVGLKDHGTLTIKDGGTVNSGSYASLGEELDSSGEVFILDLNGPGDSLWNIEGDLRIGQLGGGSLHVQTSTRGDQAKVTAGSSIHVGGSPSELSQVVVDGPGSTLEVHPASDGGIVIGANGHGSLLATNGAILSGPDGEVAGDFGSDGQATITENARWIVSNHFSVGLKAHGTLTVSNGGFVQSGGSSYIGEVLGAVGEVSIIDTGDRGEALWHMPGNLYAGYSGSAFLTIETESGEDQASVDVGPNLYAAFNATAAADIHVIGPGSALNLFDAVLGYYGMADLTLSEGAQLNANGSIHLAEHPGAHGTLTANSSGKFPTLISCNELNVGLRGIGEMCINNAGTLTAPIGIVGAAVGADGFLCLNGENVTAQFASSLDVGQRGTGILEITDATVSTPIVRLGNESTGDGTLNMIGGSLSVTTGALYIGFQGHGEMNMSDGAVVDAHALPDGLVIAAHVGSTGSLTMADPGTLMDVERQFAIERFGDATISNGAELRCRKGVSPTSSAGIISTNAPSEASLTIESNGLINCVDGFLNIGFRNNTNGTLLIHNQGKAFSVGGFIAREPGSLGDATITGAGSEWINSAPLTVGELGVGKLTVNDEGFVQAPAIIIGVNGTLEGAGGLLDGNVTNKKLVAPGNRTTPTGIIEINGSYSQTAAGKLKIELGGTIPGLHDQLLVNGNIALNGVLEIATVPGFKPQPGSTYQIALACSGCALTGSFAQVIPAATYEIIYNDDSVIVKIPGELICEADIAPAGSGNGLVDVDDLLVVINSWSVCPGGECIADITGDGNVNVDDLLAVINGWGVCPQ